MADDDFGSGTLSNANYRNQQVYGSNQFPNTLILITELRFRPDRTYGNAFSTTVSNIQINLSTTPAVPGSLSSTYANNVGADDSIVFNGELNISSAFSGPAQGPKSFDIVIPLACPFPYNPANGHLLIDIRNTSGSDASLLSGSGNYGSVASRVGGALNSATGSADSGADAIQIGYTTNNNHVVPDALATEDHDFGSGTFYNANYRNQQVYASSQFPSGAQWITGLRFRPDRTYGNAFSATVSNIQINLSTTTATPGSLSSTYANNIGADDSVMFSGELNISSAFSGPAQGPKAFDIIIQFACPFYFDPGAGNLLIDIRNTSGSDASLVSGSGDYGSVASRVGGALNSATGSADSGADAIEIITFQ
jgi:hypothetical protein